jgi:hypothetical protein
MTKFEIGKEYFTRFISNADSRITIKIIGRTEKMLHYINYEGHEQKSRISIIDGIERITPERYSMAPSWSADRIA